LKRVIQEDMKIKLRDSRIVRKLRFIW